jgi:glycosyltransferase involved in cell wall biosynthesis
MRILWVKMGSLWPLNTGGRLRSFHILSELSRRHQVTLLTTRSADNGPYGLASHLPGCKRVVAIPYTIPKYKSARFALALLRSWSSALPVDVLKFHVTSLAGEVRRLIERREVDLCIADFLSATVNVPLEGPIPVVFFAHNVEHMIWKRLCQNERNPWRRALLQLEWLKMRRYEAHVSGRVPLTIAVSEPDRALLTALAPGARIRTIPTGVDTTYFSPNGVHEQPVGLVFSGSMDWYPNEDAVLHFIEAVLPRIRREVPGVSLTVAGRNPSPRLSIAASAVGVRITGTVDDIRPYLAEAAVYVVPLRIGGGTRLKIFEALAMGKAVVSTTVGAEGLPLIPGKHFVQADDPADFGRAVVSLLRDADRRRALGLAGRRLVEERYSWAQVAHEFEVRCMEVCR